MLVEAGVVPRLKTFFYGEFQKAINNKNSYLNKRKKRKLNGFPKRRKNICGICNVILYKKRHIHKV